MPRRTARKKVEPEVEAPAKTLEEAAPEEGETPEVDAGPEDLDGSENEAADASEDDADWVDDEYKKVEEEARKERTKQEAARPRQQLDEKKLTMLDTLLDQAQMFSQFLTEQVDTMREELDESIENHAAAGDASVGNKRKRAGNGKAGKKAKDAVAVGPTQKMLPLVAGELRSYQLKGVAWMISLWHNGMNGMLADQMGLGKTVQTVAFLSHLKQNDIHGPFLIVAPLSTLSNWHSEVPRWCPSMKAIIYHGTPEERAQLRQQHFGRIKGGVVPADFPVIITTFEMAIRDSKALQKLQYKYLVVDEGHRLKNSNCLLVRRLKELHCDNKLLLTGTPLQNNLAELWSLLNFLLPQVFNSLENFESWFDFSNIVGSNDESENKSKEILESEAKNRMVSKLHEILKPFLLRRVKADVEHSLPGKQEIVMYAPLTPHQRRIQEHLINKTMDDLAKENGGGKFKLKNVLMQLRKNSNHPDLVTSDWEVTSTYPPADELIKQCGKMQLLERLLVKLKAGGHKVLIFSQFTRMLDLLDSYLDERGWKSRRIDGGIGLLERREFMADFNTDPECFVFLLSTRAGGLGINLTSADTVIIYDSDWNPHQDMQAMDRAHRIGQTKPVLVLRFCTSNSVEVKLLKRANSKLALERLVIKKGAFQGDQDSHEASASSLTQDEILGLLKGDMRLEGSAQAGVVDDAMLDTILDRSHIAKKQPCPYPDSGPGYELVAQQSAGLLSSVQ